jgi:hypothetical protein
MNSYLFQSKINSPLAYYLPRISRKLQRTKQNKLQNKELY